MRYGSRFFAGAIAFAASALSWQAVAEPGITATTIKIGAYNAVTGPIPLTGRQIQAGWQAAVRAINDAGGINGRKIELVVEDDQYEPSRSLAAARKLVDRDQVFAMTGLGTPTTIVVSKYLSSAGVPLLFPMGASSTQLNQAGLGNLFMVHPAYSTQAEIIIDWMLDNADVKKPCIIYILDPAGEDMLTGYKKIMERRKLPVIAEPYERGGTDFSAQVLKHKNSGCDFVYTSVPLEPSARIVTAADRIGFKPKFAGFTSQADSNLIKLLGPLAENFYAADMMLRIEDPHPLVQAYLADLKKSAPDIEPTFFTTYGYAAMMLIGEALKKAGPEPTRKSLIAALESWGGDGGLLGPVKFDGKNHDGKQSLYIIQVRGGKWEKVSDWVSAK